MRHVGSQFLDHELNLHPLYWQCRVLTTGLPGKSQDWIFLKGRCLQLKFSICTQLKGSKNDQQDVTSISLRWSGISGEKQKKHIYIHMYVCIFTLATYCTRISAFLYNFLLLSLSFTFSVFIDEKLEFRAEGRTQRLEDAFE